MPTSRLIALGSDSTARLPCADGPDDAAAASTPAEGNDAAGPSGAGPSVGMEVGPPAACAPKRGIEITQTPKRALPLRAFLCLPQTRRDHNTGFLYGGVDQKGVELAARA